MKKAIFSIVSGFALLWLTAVVGGPEARAAVVDRVVARVGDQVITHWELEQATTPYLLQQGMSPSVLDNQEKRAEIYQKVLDSLVNRQLIQREANKIDLSVNDQQVEQWMQMTRRRQNLSKQQFETMLSRYGMDYDTYRETVRHNLLKIRLVKVKLGSQVSVPQSEVDAAYREQFGGASEGAKIVELRQILFEPESEAQEDVEAARTRAEAVREKLESGREFEELAEQYGEGPSSKKGGYLGSFERGELNEAFERVAFDLEAGQHSGIVETKFGLHILKVDDVRRKADSNVQQRKKQIRKKLREKKMQEQMDVYIDNLRRDAFVEVNRDAIILDQ